MKHLEKRGPIRHLDNTSSTEERKDILQWFKNARCNFDFAKSLQLVLMSLLVDTIVLIY
jgi:hypothetical protein